MTVDERKMVKRDLRAILGWKAGSVLAGLVLVVVAAIFVLNEAPRLHASSSPAYVPKAGDSFAHYLEQNQQRIRSALAQYHFDREPQPFTGGYSLDQVAAMRAPYQLGPEQPRRCVAGSDAPTQGFLLVHGLTDSPYLLRPLAEALTLRYPCALIRGLLSPGHGTIPGDLRTVTLRQWTDTFAWGVESFDAAVDELYVVGYSNGAALALHYLQQDRQVMPIDKLVLLSPGLRAMSDNAYLAAYLRYLWPWIYKREDRDAAKYESFPSNAAALFYGLTRLVETRPLAYPDTPTLMLVSADDATTDSGAAIDFFCARLNSPEKALVLYHTQHQQTPASACDGIFTRQPGTVPPRFVAFSHIALTLPMSDPHYGIDGHFPVCHAHESDPSRLERCRTMNGGSVYAENNFMDQQGLYDGALVRRSSFNPDFDGMLTMIGCFIDGDAAPADCAAGDLPPGVADTDSTGGEIDERN